MRRTSLRGRKFARLGRRRALIEARVAGLALNWLALVLLLLARLEASTATTEPTHQQLTELAGGARHSSEAESSALGKQQHQQQQKQQKQQQQQLEQQATDDYNDYGAYVIYSAPLDDYGAATADNDDDDAAAAAAARAAPRPPEATQGGGRNASELRADSQVATPSPFRVVFYAATPSLKGEQLASGRPTTRRSQTRRAANAQQQQLWRPKTTAQSAELEANEEEEEEELAKEEFSLQKLPQEPEAGAEQSPAEAHKVHYWRLIWLVLPLGATFGNLLVIMAVYLERSLQSVTNYFIVSLAFADLFVGLIVMPFAVYVLVNDVWELSDAICDIYVAVDVTCSTASILNLVAISIDRYRAVAHPISYSARSGSTRAILTIFAVWLISCCVGAPIILGLNTSPERKSTLCIFYNSTFIFWSSLTSFYAPCIIMIGLYWRIFSAIRRRTKKAMQAGNLQHSNSTKPALALAGQNLQLAASGKHRSQAQAASLTGGHAPQAAKRAAGAAIVDAEPNQTSTESNEQPATNDERRPEAQRSRQEIILSAQSVNHQHQLRYQTLDKNRRHHHQTRHYNNNGANNNNNKNAENHYDDDDDDGDDDGDDRRRHHNETSEELAASSIPVAPSGGARRHRSSGELKQTHRSAKATAQFDSDEARWPASGSEPAARPSLATSSCQAAPPSSNSAQAARSAECAHLSRLLKKERRLARKSITSQRSALAGADLEAAGVRRLRNRQEEEDDDDDGDGDEEDEEDDEDDDSSEGSDSDDQSRAAAGRSTVASGSRSQSLRSSSSSAASSPGSSSLQTPSVSGSRENSYDCSTQLNNTHLPMLTSSQADDSRRSSRRSCCLNSATVASELGDGQGQPTSNLDEQTSSAAQSPLNSGSGACATCARLLQTTAASGCRSELLAPPSGATGASNSRQTSLCSVECSATPSSGNCHQITLLTLEGRKLQSCAHLAGAEQANEQLCSWHLHAEPADATNAGSRKSSRQTQCECSLAIDDEDSCLHCRHQSASMQANSRPHQELSETRASPTNQSDKKGQVNLESPCACLEERRSAAIISIQQRHLTTGDNQAQRNSLNATNQPPPPPPSAVGVLQNATEKIKRRSIKLGQLIRGRSSQRGSTNIKHSPSLSTARDGLMEPSLNYTLTRACSRTLSLDSPAESSGAYLSQTQTNQPLATNTSTSGQQSSSNACPPINADRCKANNLKSGNQTEALFHRLSRQSQLNETSQNQQLGPTKSRKTSELERSNQESVTVGELEVSKPSITKAARQSCLVATVINLITQQQPNKEEASNNAQVAVSSNNNHNKRSAVTNSLVVLPRAHRGSRRRREKNAARRERKATKTLAIVLGVFLICWVPFFTCNIIDGICIQFNLDYRVRMWVYLVTSWLGYMNSCVNPIIYTIFNMEFRRAFKRILTTSPTCCNG